jgi:Fe-S-cluster-containing hydrogenase component 2
LVETTAPEYVPSFRLEDTDELEEGVELLGELFSPRELPACVAVCPAACVEVKDASAYRMRNSGTTNIAATSTERANNDTAVIAILSCLFIASTFCY